jgi:hypothetical protein
VSAASGSSAAGDAAAGCAAAADAVGLFFLVAVGTAAAAPPLAALFLGLGGTFPVAAAAPPVTPLFFAVAVAFPTGAVPLLFAGGAANVPFPAFAVPLVAAPAPAAVVGATMTPGDAVGRVTERSVSVVALGGSPVAACVGGGDVIFDALEAFCTRVEVLGGPAAAGADSAASEDILENETLA